MNSQERNIMSDEGRTTFDITNTTNPLVSIIIPTFNYGRYLKECIDSTLNQTYDNIEIIIVNDGSTDNTLQVLKEYQTKEYQNIIRIISHSENRGLSAARNTGINNMNGEYVKFSDADDVMYLDAIEKLVNRAKQLDKKKCIVFANVDFMTISGNIIERYEYPDCNNMSTREINARLLAHYYIAPTSSLLHRSIFEYGIFDEDIKFNEDYDLWLRLCILHGCTIHLLPEPILKSRKHAESLSATTATKAYEQNNIIKNNILDQLEPSQRNYYIREIKRLEIELARLERKITIRYRIRILYQNLMYKLLGGSYTIKILDKYCKLRYKRPFT